MHKIQFFFSFDKVNLTSLNDEVNLPSLKITMTKNKVSLNANLKVISTETVNTIKF